MKFLVVALATLAVGQVSVVDQALQSIGDSTRVLGNAFSSINSSSTILQAAPLVSISDYVKSNVTQGIANVSRIDLLSDNDALGLAVPINDLNKDVSFSVDQVISKKDIFVKLQLGPIVYNQLVGLRYASANFSLATIEKVYHGLHKIALDIASPVLENLDRGLAAYEDQVNASARITFAPLTLPDVSGASATEVAGFGAIVVAAFAAVAVL